ncbi:MAG: hypothetical protein JWM93_3432 [Frankiales bacterium]|nr:hypothetical protein [Frankiales bacterium]
MAQSASRGRSLRTAGGLSMLLGLGFGLPGVLGARHFARTGQVWSFMGFPTYGDGPFQRIGIATTVPLLVAFDAVCGAEVLCGVLLWQQRRSGIVMSAVLLPFECAFWAGFLLPFGPPIGVARTGLALWHRRG